MTTDSDQLCRTAGGGVPRLLEIMRRLRAPEGGCPWDHAQTFDTIAPHTIEEAYEVADAIARQAWGELQHELGDLLFQIVYHAQMAQEQGFFDFHDVVESIAEKMVIRHPHVFGPETRDKTAAQQVEDWETQKAKERAQKGAKGVLDDVTLGLPALTRAIKLQNRAARVGFDWPDMDYVLKKLEEEIGELTEARETLGPAEVADEMGDVLFVAVNIARHLGVDPEEALRQANAKFIRRFQAMEHQLAQQNRSIQETDLAEMDTLWDAAKHAERAHKS